MNGGPHCRLSSPRGGRFHLYDLRAHVRHEHRTYRSGQNSRKINNKQVIERFHVFSSHSHKRAAKAYQLSGRLTSQFYGMALNGFDQVTKRLLLCLRLRGMLANRGCQGQCAIWRRSRFRIVFRCRG